MRLQIVENSVESVDNSLKPGDKRSPFLEREHSSLFSRICVSFVKFWCGGDTASTWVLKHKEHSGAPEDLVKTGTL
jgi:hypothetical protein